MKSQHFKIIELPTHQVLVTKEFDDKNNISLINVSFFMDKIRLSYEFSYDTEKERDEAFNLFDSDKANDILIDTVAMIGK